MGQMVKFRLLGFSLAILMVMLGVTLSPQIALADPHAVFLTVVGQQQLFFNVLAALNQADYVESLQLRQQLAEKRDANYSPSSASALRETETELADLLTRSVTLEGQDVRTQQRSDDYAREVVRQRRLAELFEKLCREAFGSEKCQFKQEKDDRNGQGILKERERAFIQDPVAFNNLPDELGALAALSSGTDEHDQKAEEILELPFKQGPALPYAYSPEIAEIRQRLEGKGDLLKIFNDAVKDVERDYKPPEFDINAWVNELEVKNGEVQLHSGTCTVTVCVGGHTAFEIIAHISFGTRIGITLSRDLGEIARQAQERVASQLQDTIVDGAVPDRVHKVSAGDEQGRRLGEIGTLVSAPANVKVGLQRDLLSLLTQVETNPNFIDPSQIDNPAGESAVEKDDKGNYKSLKIGAPLEEFAKADVIEKGLLEQSGITEKPREIASRNLLQQFISQIVSTL